MSESRIKKGFTLLELLIVLTIIGVASAIVGVSLYRSLDDIRLKGSAKEIAAALRYARVQAVVEKRIYTFSLDPEKRLYYISAWFPLESPPSPGGEGWVMGNTLPKGITLVSKDRVEISFYPLGSSTGGRFGIRNDKGSIWTLRIDSATGRVSLIKG